MVSDVIWYFETITANNRVELANVEHFRTHYSPNEAINWYTKNTFLYRLLNKALRTEDVYLLYCFRFYIIDLCRHLEHENILRSNTLTLYRGQTMIRSEFEKLKIDSIISPNGFFSTSKNINVAL